MPRGLLALAAALLLPLAAHAQIDEGEPNDTPFDALDLNPHFAIGINPFVDNAATVPFVSILATGDDTEDAFFFTITEPGTIGVFDIDFADTGGPGSFNALIDIYGFTMFETNDDAVALDAGSTSLSDPYLTVTFTDPGDYFVVVFDNCGCGVPLGATYQLQVSLQAPAPEPAAWAMMLGGFAVAGSAVRSRRRRLPTR